GLVDFSGMTQRQPGASFDFLEPKFNPGWRVALVLDPRPDHLARVLQFQDLTLCPAAVSRTRLTTTQDKPLAHPWLKVIFHQPYPECGRFGQRLPHFLDRMRIIFDQ